MTMERSGLHAPLNLLNGQRPAYGQKILNPPDCNRRVEDLFMSCYLVEIRMAGKPVSARCAYAMPAEPPLNGYSAYLTDILPLAVETSKV